MDPYGYAYQNPVRFIDPTGMKGLDWVYANGEVLNDSSVTNQEQATAKYGEGAVHFAPGSKYTTFNKAEIVLGENGHYTKNGEAKYAADHAGVTPSDNSAEIESIVSQALDSPAMKHGSAGGALITEAGKAIEKAVDARKIDLTTGKTTYKNPYTTTTRHNLKIRQLNVNTYSGIKYAGKALGIAGVFVTAASVANDFAEGNAAAGVTRIGVNAIIYGVGSVCVPCGLGLSIAEAYYGEKLYNAAQEYADSFKSLNVVQ